MQLKEPQAILRQAEDFFRKANYDKTLAVLVDGFSAYENFRPFYTLAGQTLELMKAQDEAVLFWQALEHFEDWEPFFKLGYHFIDVWHYDMAKPFLLKAHKLSPSNPDCVHELALCYANTFEISQAVNLLEAFDNHDFWTVYRLHRYWLLTNKPSPIQEYIDESFQKLATFEQDEEAIPQAYHLLHELQAMLTRYHLLDTPVENSLAVWHFIQYGTALIEMNLSESTANGRYLDYEGTFSTIHDIMNQVANYLTSFQYHIKKIVYLENTDDAVLGEALAQILAIPSEEADGKNLKHPNTLIVAADNKTLNGEHDLWEIQAHQIVFSLRVSWSQPSMICPELIGIMAKNYQLPWKRDLKKEIIKEVAKQITHSKPTTANNTEWLNFYKKVYDASAVHQNMQKKRNTFRAESPIEPPLS